MRLTASPSLKLAFKLLVPLGILWLVFTLVPFSEVLPVLRTTDPVPFALGTLLLFIMRWLASMRMKTLIEAHGIRISTTKILEISLAAAFYVQILPGNLAGGAVRWYRLNRVTGKGAEVLSAIVLDRLVDTLVVIVLGVGFWLARGHNEGENLGWVLLAVVSALTLCYVLFFNGRVTGVVARFVRRLRRLPSLLHGKLVKLFDAVHHYRDLRAPHHVRILGLSVTKDLLGILGLVLYAQSLSLDLGFVVLGWVRAFIILIALLPLAFSGLGVREGGLVILLQPYGIDAGSAVAFSLLVMAGNLVMAGAGGLWELRNLLSGGEVRLPESP